MTGFVHHTQLFGHDPDIGIFGDCYRTSLAMMLGLKPIDVPHFCNSADSSSDWQTECGSWLAARGLCAVDIPYAGDFAPEPVRLICDQARLTFGDAVVGISGKSPRGFHHQCVIYRGELYDPHPTRLGLSEPGDDGYYWVTVLTRRCA